MNWRRLGDADLAQVRRFLKETPDPVGARSMRASSRAHAAPVKGRENGSGEVEGDTLFSALPVEVPMPAEDRFVFGGFTGERLDALIELVRAHPTRQAVLLSRILPFEDSIYAEAERLARQWAGIERLRLSTRVDQPVHTEFWKLHGFLTGEKAVKSAKSRSYLKIAVASRELPDLRRGIARPLTHDDAPALGALLERSFRGTIDDEGETVEQFVGEIRQTMLGKYGPFIAAASFGAESPAAAGEAPGRMLGASVITIWKERPLLAFSATDPDFQGQGIAKALISRSLSRMAELGYRELYLSVTDGNLPAITLYRKLGFRA